jgi:hypothetical protein
MRTSFHHQPEAQHPKSSAIHSWPADYPIFGSRPCENSNARHARRNILDKLSSIRTDNTVNIRLGAMYIFYIFRMYEFSHSLGH